MKLAPRCSISCLSVSLALLASSCGAPGSEPGPPATSGDGAFVSEASAPAESRASAADLIGRWVGGDVELELRGDGSYSWDPSPGVAALERVPPLPRAGRWTLHSPRADADGVERASVLRFGQDGMAGTLVALVSDASGLRLELLPGELELARR